MKSASLPHFAARRQLIGPPFASAFLLLLFCLGGNMLFANPIPAGPATALAAFRLKNNTGQNLTDYHLVIEHAASDPGGVNLDPKKKPFSKVGSAIFSNPITPAMMVRDNLLGMTALLTLDLTVAVPKGDSLLVSLPLVRRKNEFLVYSSYWTGDDVLRGPNVKIADVAIPGFSVKGDPEYTIFNGFDEAMGIRGLQFLFDVPEIDAELIDPGLMPGFGAVVDDFVLPGHSSLTFFIPGMLDHGNFLYAQGSVFDTTFTTETASFLHGHQEPVPEPGPLLALLAPVLASFVVWRQLAAIRHSVRPVPPAC
jgi:hypothetical protein